MPWMLIHSTTDIINFVVIKETYRKRIQESRGKYFVINNIVVCIRAVHGKIHVHYEFLCRFLLQSVKNSVAQLHKDYLKY